jgi:hypothetical protein
MNYSCFPFQKILKEADKTEKTKGEVTPEEFSTLIVRNSEGNMNDISTMAALRPGAAAAITKRVKKLADALLATKTAPETIRSIFDQTQYGSPDAGGYKPYEDYRDVKHMAYLLASDGRISDRVLTNAARKLYDALGEGGIVAEYHDKNFYRGTPGTDSVSGLSIYLPTDAYADGSHSYPENLSAKDIEPAYKATEFARETGWDKVLEKFFKPRA